MFGLERVVHGVLKVFWADVPIDLENFSQYGKGNFRRLLELREISKNAFTVHINIGRAKIRSHLVKIGQKDF